MDIRPNFKYHTPKNPFLSTLFELGGKKRDCRPVEFLWTPEMAEEDAKQRRSGAEMTKKTKQLTLNKAKNKKEKDEARARAPKGRTKARLGINGVRIPAETT